MKIQYFLKRVKDVKIKDFLQVFVMITALALSPFYKRKYKDVWLICETDVEARDNGYWFFKYMVEQRPKQKCIYAIRKNSVDYRKVASIGQTVQTGSVLHWIIYFTCKHNISSQKGDGKPNPALCAFIELNNWYDANNIFLQHGIIINKNEWLFADRSRFKLFITSTKPETQYVKDNFGYPEDVIKLCGLPRFDNLHRKEIVRNRIVVMPTWRAWFTLPSAAKEGITTNFLESDYYINWKAFLESDVLNTLAETKDLEIIFFMHRNMQMFVDEFNKIRTKAKIARWEDYDIQEILYSSQMMITDYSSVFFDMIYMKKPIVFFQFDIDEFRKAQYEEGYFHYDNNPFGKSFVEVESLVDEVKYIIEEDYRVSEKYLAEHNNYFMYYDDMNSERVYDAIKALDLDEI